MVRRFAARVGQTRDRWRPQGESGQGLAEYGLILALIAIVCIAGLQALGLGIAGSPGFTTLPGAM